MNTVTDFIIQVKNAYLARRHTVEVPYANILLAIGKVLVKEGYLSEVKAGDKDGHKRITATLRYVRRRPVLHGVKVVSKPSLRTYQGAKDVARVKRGATTAVLSTNMGVMTGKEAVKKGVGGELLFLVW